MSRRGFAPIILIVTLVVIIIVGLAGFRYLFDNADSRPWLTIPSPSDLLPGTSSNNETLTPEEEQKVQPLPSAFTDTSTWKTYSTDSFSIKYPADWKTEGNTIHNKFFSLSRGNTEKLLEKGSIGISFVPADKVHQGLDRWLSDDIRESKLESDTGYTIIKPKIETVQNSLYPVLIIEGKGYGNLNFRTYFIQNPVDKTGVKIRIDYPYDEIDQQKVIIDQILSTFHFLK